MPDTRMKTKEPGQDKNSPKAEKHKKATSKKKAEPCLQAEAKPGQQSALTPEKPLKLAALKKTLKKDRSYPGDPSECLDSNDPSALLNCAQLYFNRELNWLDFNKKVLDQAVNTHLPLLEQLKFLSIFYNNLDEFYMVRVANIQRQYASSVGNKAPDGLSPARQLAEIRRTSLQLSNIAEEHWRRKLRVQLGERNVHIVPFAKLSHKQKSILRGFFENEIYPILTPQAVDPSHPFPTISNICLNFLIQLKNNKDGSIRYARLKVPTNLPRFIFVPRTKEAKTYASLGYSTNIRDDDIVLLEDLIHEYLAELFPGNSVLKTGMFRITRNTDVEIEEDEADDLLEAIKDLVEQRRFGDVVRLEVGNSMAADLVQFLAKHLKLKPFQIYKVKGPLGFSDLMALFSIDRPGLKYDVFTPHKHDLFVENNPFSRIQEEDVFLYHPYDSFNPVVDFIRRASEDPDVMAIKQTLYRVGNNSPVVEALIQARRLGKQVTAVVELKARFDEERNITWAEELEKSGVNVVYGLIGMKIHAKLCLVVRRESEGVKRYVHIGTGNYNPSSAKMYSDMALFTANPDICADVTDLFNAVTGYAQLDHYRKLLVSPTTMRSGLLAAIEKEIELHKAHGQGEIIFKCNQLVDKECIQALYRASMAGVSVHLQVRGICCLRPGLPNISENIEVTTLVGRFLEHPRLYWFRHNGEGQLFMGSADIMPRNLDRRVEVLTPILNPRLRASIRNDILAVHLRDTVNAYTLLPDGTYVHKKSPENQSVNSQAVMMQKHTWYE